MPKSEENLNINHMNVARDKIKGLSKKQIISKYNITDKLYDAIIIYYDSFIKKSPKRKIDSVADLYDKNYDLKFISQSLGLDYNLTSYFAHKSLISKEIGNIAMNSLPERMKLLNDGKCGIIADFWFSGGTEAALKDLGISSSFLERILDSSIPVSECSKRDDIRVYKYIMAQAYDFGIINDSMLDCIFSMDEGCAGLLMKDTGGNVLRFANNSLYQIYKNPELLGDFTFTSDEMEQKALDFKKRRSSEEVLNLQYRKIRNNNRF